MDDKDLWTRSGKWRHNIKKSNLTTHSFIMKCVKIWDDIPKVKPLDINLPKYQFPIHTPYLCAFFLNNTHFTKEEGSIFYYYFEWLTLRKCIFLQTYGSKHNFLGISAFLGQSRL